MTKGHLLFLGTGASLGVPVVGCECKVCQSDIALNKRLRPSAILNVKSKQFLIDAGPDLRMQALKYHIHTLDGVLLTHAHHDHTAGLDDLKVFSYKNQRPLPILLSAETQKEILERYSYLFSNLPNSRFALHVLPSQLEGQIEFEEILITYVSYTQPNMSVKGFRIGNLAYLSDIKEFPDSIFYYLEGVENLIVGALRYTPSPFHFSIDEAIDFIRQSGSKRAWLTHLSHELDHEKTSAYLPSNIELAYDGLQINFNFE